MLARGATPSSVSRVRRAVEHSTSSGSIAFVRRCSAITLQARWPRGASGRSWSSSRGSSQLDFAWRRTNNRLVGGIGLYSAAASGVKLQRAPTRYIARATAR